MKSLAEKFGISLDGAAIAMSAACILHCLLTPVLVILFPILGSTALADDSFHGLLLVIIIPTSAMAFYLGCRRHGEGSVLVLGVAGIVVLLVAALLGVVGLGIVGEKVATGIGGTLLALGHVQNFRRCRAHRCEETAVEHTPPTPA